MLLTLFVRGMRSKMADKLELVTDNNLDRIATRFDGGSGGGNNGSMDARVTALEKSAQETREKLVRIEAKQDEFIKHYATKADLTEAKNSIIMWIVSAILLAQVLPAILKKLGL